MKICLKSGICQVLQRSRQLMWCHSGLGWWLSAMPSLKSESGADPILPTNRGDALAILLEYEDCQYKQEFQRQRLILKKQFCRRKVLLKSESLFLVAEAWMCHIVTGNNPLSRPMQQNCRNWCPATTLGMIFWVWFDLWRLLWETISNSCSVLEVFCYVQ